MTSVLYFSHVRNTAGQPGARAPQAVRDHPGAARPGGRGQSAVHRVRRAWRLRAECVPGAAAGEGARRHRRGSVSADHRGAMTMSAFERAMRAAGDLDDEFYLDERQRDVWNEAAAVGFQLFMW